MKSPALNHILILDDNESDRLRMELICRDILRQSARSCSTPEQAFELLHTSDFDLMIIDKNIEIAGTGRVINGIDLIPEILQIKPLMQILVVTSSKDIADVVNAIRLGALSYLAKDSPTELVTAQIEKALQLAVAVRKDKVSILGDSEVQSLRLVGTSHAIRQLRIQLQAVAESGRPVLLTGESGTGKTTAAKIIHQYRLKYTGSNDRPFFSVNMAAITPSLAERELFGHEKGAFTDAKDTSPGIFELASGGTLFLDEIAEASPDLQAKLLKVIEEKRFMRIGGKKEIHADFKLICATNRDLEHLVTEGKFREDLFMRISTFPLRMPSLKERAEDIPEIIRSILHGCCIENNVFIRFDDLPSDFIEYIRGSDIRGNIRGIEHLISRLLVFSPKDAEGKPVLTLWRQTLNPKSKQSAESVLIQKLTPKMLDLPFDLIQDGFEGVTETMRRIEEKIYLEAFEKYKKTADIADALGVSTATASRILIQAGKRRRDRSKRGQSKRGQT